MAPSSPHSATPRTSILAGLGGLVILSIPAGVLALAAMRTGHSLPPVLSGGVATLAFLALGLLREAGAARAARHKLATPLYLAAVLILWFSAPNTHDEFIQGAMGVLLGVPLTLFVFQEILFTGRAGLRRARALVRRIAAKLDWPADLTACKLLPEVKALREALREDAEPVLELLGHPKAEVRVAALAALEFRPSWAKGQPEAVLRVARFAAEPLVRAGALTALANVDDPALAAAIGRYLRDPAPEVRRAAAEALLWDAARRWAQVRREIRAGLADPRCLDDGPLPCTGGLPDTAVHDLTAWAGEAGPIGLRSARTLLAHYRRELEQSPGPEVVDALVVRALDARAASALRVEIAHLLAERDGIDARLWQELLRAEQPSALRLLAAGMLLRDGATDQAALGVLREVALAPNREMALQVAAIVQKCLRVDMGLPLGGALPEAHSKQAAEVARRVMDWVAGRAKPLRDEAPARRTRVTNLARQISRPTGENPRRRI
jgi:hypothetical protein